MQDSAASSTEQRLSQELLGLYDELVEFQGCCAFLCDAFVAFTTQGVEMDRATTHGLHIYSGQVKQRLQQLKERLHELRTQLRQDATLPG